MIADLAVLAARLEEADPRVTRVLLFGSLATGRATIRSDADLLIVLSEHPRPGPERIPDYLPAFLDAPLPVDVVPLTEEEIRLRRARGDPFLEMVDREGILLTA